MWKRWAWKIANTKRWLANKSLWTIKSSRKINLTNWISFGGIHYTIIDSTHIQKGWRNIRLNKILFEKIKSVQVVQGYIFFDKIISPPPLPSHRDECFLHFRDNFKIHLICFYHTLNAFQHVESTCYYSLIIRYMMSIKLLTLKL